MFGKAALVFTSVLCLVSLGESTEINACKDGRTLDTIKTVDISNCQQGVCNLKKDTRVGISQRFVPDRNVEKLRNSVNAKLFGIPLPFVGVDGSDACKSVYDTAGNHVGCPLTAGTEYVYKNEFPILRAYPKVSTVVHWALEDQGTPITCFEIRTKIVA